MAKAKISPPKGGLFLTDDVFYIKLSEAERILEKERIGASVIIQNVRDVYLECEKERREYPDFLKIMFTSDVESLIRQFKLITRGM